MHWSDVGNFPGAGSSPVAMHLLKNLDSHSDTMQPVLFENLDGMSLRELLDFILKLLMRSWISHASVGVRNNETFEFICLKIYAKMDRWNVLHYKTTTKSHHFVYTFLYSGSSHYCCCTAVHSRKRGAWKNVQGIWRAGLNCSASRGLATPATDSYAANK